MPSRNEALSCHPIRASKQGLSRAPMPYAPDMKRVLLTGMSGTGKSTLIERLRARGYKAVDADESGWSEYRPSEHGPGGREWMWREDRVRALLAERDAEVLFLSGCASNQVQFYPQFDHVVLLTAPVDVMLERLASRTNNPYGKHPDELAWVLKNKEMVEPLLRPVATWEIDTSAPLDDVVSKLLRLIGERVDEP